MRCAATTRVYAEVIRCKYDRGHVGAHRGANRGIESVWSEGRKTVRPERTQEQVVSDMEMDRQAARDGYNPNPNR